MSFSILILTQNEEKNLPVCLDSVKNCNDVVVLDSFSSDRTKDITHSRGVRFYERSFDDFANQRNYALENIPFKNDWVFHLDADERFTPELYDECERGIVTGDYDGYLVPAKIIFMGKWIRYASEYPVYQVRLVHKERFRFIQAGHGQREKAGLRIGKLTNPYQHYSLSKGLNDWFEKHNRYSNEEAAEILKTRRNAGSIMKHLFHSDALVRRRAVKSISSLMPLKPTFRFIYQYLFRLGFLDGYAGFCYCRLLSIYELMITMKQKEMNKKF